MLVALPSAVDEAIDQAFTHGICVALQVLYAAGQQVLWRELIMCAGQEKVLYFAANIEPAEWELTGLKVWAWPELKQRKPRRHK